MARQETIRILRSEVLSATPSLTSGEVAVNLADRKFFVGGTGGTSDRITFRDELSTVQSVNGQSRNIVITGDSASMRVVPGVDSPGGQETNTFVISNRIASTSLTGVASFYSNDFFVSHGGEVSISTSGATPVVFRDAFNNTVSPKWETTLTLTGGNGVEVHRSNAVASTIIFSGTTASAARSGVASFLSDHFTVGATGHVSLATAYQATGDTVITVPGSGIALSTSGKTDTIFNIGVTGFNGLTGNITVTGDGGSLVGRDNNRFTNRLATTSLTGVASFNSSYFSVGTTGHVTLATAYQATGDSVVAGSGIAISANKTITNIGVTGIGFGSDVGLTGKVNITAGSNITITQSGNLITFSGVAQQVTAVTGDGGAIVGRDNSNITARIATTGVTGVASFLSTHFTVSGTGHVSLATAYQATGDSVQAGSGIAISVNKTITNIGVTGFNGLTGNITVTGDGGSLVGKDNNRFTNRLATTGLTGVASFLSTHFAVSGTGHVSLASGYQATGDSVQAGSGIAISANKTITNIGVTGIGFGLDVGLTGKVNITAGSNITITQSGNLITFSGVAQQVTAVTGDGAAIVGKDNSNITARLATTGVTGVASFNSSYFSVSSGAVSLAAAYQATGDNSRIATAALTGVASFDPRFFTVGSTGHVILVNSYQATGDSVQAGSGIAISANKTITNIGVTSFNGLTGMVSLTGCGGAVRGSDNSCITVRNASGTLTGVASFNPTYFSVGATGHVLLSAAYQATGDTVITVAGSGIALSTSGKTKTIFNIGVTGFNGLTGNITVTGDGGSLVGKDNNKFTNRITYLWDDTATPTTGLTGVSMFNCRDFTVDAAGLVSLAAFSQCNGGGGGGCDCSQYTTQGTCEAAMCGWLANFPSGGSCYCPSAFNSPYSGLGVSADANGGVSFLYFDIGNLSAAPSGTTILSTDSILFYDASETGLIKTKRATISKLILDSDALFASKTTDYLQKTKSATTIDYEIVTSAIEQSGVGLVVAAEAFDYISLNTVKSLNGLTGDVTVVGSVNGCSGNAITITGTVNEVNVTNSCPTITIGLPDNVTIPYISGTGATFTGTVNANLFIGSVDGGTF